MAKGGYLGYVKRDVENQIDWQQVGKGISDFLIEENKAREEAKSKIEANTRANIDKVLDNPQGQHQGVNAGMANYSNYAQEMLLSQDKMLKSGILSLRDYTLQRQNIMDGTNDIFDFAKDYQDKYSDMMTRIEGLDPANASQLLEAEGWEEMGGMIDFTTHDFYINPVDYTVMIGKKNEQGEIDPNTLQSLQSVKNSVNIKYNKFNVKGFFDERKNDLAAWQMGYRNGQTIKSALKNPELKNYITNTQGEVKANPYNISSILTENISPTLAEGERYRYVDSQEEFDNDTTGKVILRKKAADGSGRYELEFQDSQIDAVDKFIQGQITQRIGYSETAPRQTSGRGGGRGGGRTIKQQLSIEMVENVNNFTTGDSASANRAEQRMIEFYNRNKKPFEDKMIKKIDRADDGAILITFNQQGRDFIEQIPASDNNEDRQETLFRFINPDDKEYNWTLSLEEYRRSLGKDIDSPSKNLKGYQSVYASRTIPVYNGLDDMPEGDGTVKSNLDNQKFGSYDVTAQTEAIENSLFRMFPPDANINVKAQRNPNNKNEWTVTIETVDGEELVSESIEWKRGIGIGKLVGSQISDQLSGIYRTAAQRYNRGVTSPKTSDIDTSGY